MGYSAMDVPVKLPKSLKTQLMLLEPVSSLTRYTPGLSVADSLVSSQVTYCRKLPIPQIHQSVCLIIVLLLLLGLPH